MATINLTKLDAKRKIKASVLSENVPITDKNIWDIKCGDPKKHYVFARENDEIEMNHFALQGYKAADGAEEIMGSSLIGNVDIGPGKIKRRGNRILLWCPKDVYEAREQEMIARNDAMANIKKQSRNEARQLMEESGGAAGVTPLDDVSLETQQPENEQGEG